MARYCQVCGKKMSWFAERILSESVCDQCKMDKEKELMELDGLTPEVFQIINEVVTSNNLYDRQLNILRRHSKEELIKFYSKVYYCYRNNGNLSEQEINTLSKIQDNLSLTKAEIQYDELVLPYLYANKIKTEGSLPIANLPNEVGTQIIIRKDEVTHFVCKAILKEIRTTEYEWEGSTQGVSFPILDEINFQIGKTKGHIVKEDKLIETSRGLFLVTNQRLFLNPSGNNKPLSIPLDKILSYSCFANGIQVYQEGREQGYFINISNSSFVEIVGLCLGHLLSAKS